MLRTIEVLLLSIDPTAGVLSLFFIGGLAAISRGITAAFSRDNEREADDLGVEVSPNKRALMYRISSKGGSIDFYSVFCITRTLYPDTYMNLSQIAARACFDTVAGAEVMKKMHYLSTLETKPLGGAAGGTTTGVTLANLYDSHPPSPERYETIKKKAVQYNKEHHSHCHGVIQRLLNSVWRKPRSHIEADDAMEHTTIKKQSPSVT